jgi:phosphotransferase system  glucose/maltose/N-acetylglucosamine-specific IIC component
MQDTWSDAQAPDSMQPNRKSLTYIAIALIIVALIYVVYTYYYQKKKPARKGHGDDDSDSDDDGATDGLQDDILELQQMQYMNFA